MKKNVALGMAIVLLVLSAVALGGAPVMAKATSPDVNPCRTMPPPDIEENNMWECATDHEALAVQYPVDAPVLHLENLNFSGSADSWFQVLWLDSDTGECQFYCSEFKRANTLNELQPGETYYVIVSEPGTLWWDTEKTEDIARAILGPLSGAQVSVSLLSDLGNPVYTTETDEQGNFGKPLTGVSEDAYVLVSVSGGEDTDANDDGIPDAIPTPNLGTIHALLTVSDFNDGFNVSALTDIAWQYTKAMVGEVCEEAVQIRLDDLAEFFFLEDTNGDGEINSLDFTEFDPLDGTHKTKLCFPYESLLESDESGDSIIGCYHANEADVLLELLDEKFETYLTRFPAADFRNPCVKVHLVPFGEGSVTSSVGAIDWNSERGSELNATIDFYAKDPATTITLMASPTDETEILEWTGVDEVSADKTQAEVALGFDREVGVSFGYKETIVDPNFVDLTRAQTSIEGSTITVMLAKGDNELISRMADMTAGWYVAGPSDAGGFLCRVLSVEKITDLRYNLETESASLEDVIQQGTGVMSRWMTHGDLADNYTILDFQIHQLSVGGGEDTPAGRLPSGDGYFTGIDGVRLLPSDDPDDTVFTFEFGQPALVHDISTLSPADMILQGVVWDNTAGLVLYEDKENGVKVTVKGSLDAEFKLDTGVSFGWTGLKDFRLIPTVETTENLKLEIKGAVDTKKLEDALKWTSPKITFPSITFSVGPVPVWITPTFTLTIGTDLQVKADVTTSVTLKQTATAGITYNRDRADALQTTSSFHHSEEFTPPSLNLTLKAKGYIQPEVSALFYDLSGPSFFIQPYLELGGTSKSIAGLDCEGGINFYARVGLTGGCKWDFPDNNALGKFLHLDELETKSTIKFIEDKQWDLAKWNHGGDCFLPAKLKVQGPNINETVLQGDGEVIEGQYTLSNVGEEDLDWSIATLWGSGFVHLSKTSGKLAPNEAIVIDVSVDTGDMMSGVCYWDQLIFHNDTVQDEAEVRDIMIAVFPRLVAPVLDEPELYADTSTIVELTWEYPDSGSAEYVDGYYVFQSTDGEYWDAEPIITDSDETRCLVTNLLSDQTYYFRVVAFSSDGEGLQSDPSNTVSITLGEYRPAHFSGLLMCDYYSPPWMTEVFVDDAFSEYVGAGMYPLNSEAFPNATAYTFDGIAIAPGVRVTVYSEPNYQGEILWQKTGPAIVNNSIWRDYSQAAPVMYDWKEPLQSMFPQSVREWSDTNMHNWPNGSMIIEYVDIE